MPKYCNIVRSIFNLHCVNQCSNHIKNNAPTLIQTAPFSDWKYDKGEQYFTLKKSKSGPRVILDPEQEPFESPYTKIKKQKNPSFSHDSNPDILSSLQPLLSANTQSDEEIESESNEIIEQRTHQQNELMKYNKWKTTQIKTKEYIPRSDHYKPRTLEDFKNWNIKQNEIATFKEKQHQNIKEEEELRSYDLVRDGHIVNALKPPNIKSSSNSDLFIVQNSDDIALSGKHKFDFSGDPTYVIEGMKFVEYYIHKYAYYLSSGFVKISILSSISLYLLLHQNYITQNELIDVLQTLRPFNASTLQIAKANGLYDIWWNTLFGSFMMPMVVTAGIYAKCKGEFWEYKQFKKNPIETVESMKTDVLTLQNKNNIAKNKIIYEIALIRERRKERMNALAPLEDVVDIAETFSPHRKSGLASGGGMAFTPKKVAQNTMKFNKFVKKHGIGKGLALWGSTAFSVMDPKRAGSTQNFGLLKLQTRLDEFGRVIPGWQRQKTRVWASSTVIVFLLFPCFGDWLFGWTA